MRRNDGGDAISPETASQYQIGPNNVSDSERVSSVSIGCPAEKSACPSFRCCNLSNKANSHCKAIEVFRAPVPHVRGLAEDGLLH